MNTCRQISCFHFSPFLFCSYSCLHYLGHRFQKHLQWNSHAYALSACYIVVYLYKQFHWNFKYCALIKLYSLFPEPEITCPNLPIIRNAEPWPNNVNTQYGTSYTARCLPGSAEASVSASCNERGTWDISGSCQSNYYITISCIFVLLLVIISACSREYGHWFWRGFELSLTDLMLYKSR